MGFEIPKHFTGDSTREGSLTDSPVWTWFLGYNLDVERKLAFVLPTQFESIHRYIVQLPPAYRLEGQPEAHDIVSAWGFFKLKVLTDRADPRRVEFQTHMRLEKTRVEPREFAEFIRFQDEVSRAYRVWLNLRPSSEIADAPLLEKLLAEQKPADAQSAKILARLYIDHDRLAEARAVLEKASAWFPGDKSLWELRVQASANTGEEERLYRDMVRQFPGEAKYAVALWRKACVRRQEHAGGGENTDSA